MESHIFTECIERLFNFILKNGFYPRQWKKDRRIPLFKAGDHCDVKKYRLIAIHSVFRKLFNKIIEKRIRAFIELDDAQAGFRPERRPSDNAFILNDIIQRHSHSKDKADTVILALDFSKAFDRCHIPTLIEKLVKKGVGGHLLHIITDMYLEAEARLEINGSLGEPFSVSRGVAQGCVLSPLFFAVYMDDLLQEFRECGIGIELARSFINALAFADDLTLLAADRKTAQKLLDILAVWCKRNHFVVNMDKTGVLSMANNKRPREALIFDGTPLKELEQMKYLGFLLTENGSWDNYIDLVVQRARGAVGSLWYFFSSGDISFAQKIEIAGVLALSKLSHGQDIIHLTKAHKDKLHSLIGKMLRAVLGQPRRSKTQALQIITGQYPVDFSFHARRAQNALRISNLPENRIIRSFSSNPLYQTRNSTAGTFIAEIKLLRREQRFSKITLDALEDCIASPNKQTCKRICTEIYGNSYQVQLRRELQESHSSTLLQIFDSFKYYPLLKRKGPMYSNLITWMTASTILYGDLTNHERMERSSERCRLCQNDTESRFHMLSECPMTAGFVATYSEKIRGISRVKHKEYVSISLEDRWLWIIGSGCIPIPKPEKAARRDVPQSIFIPGDNVKEGKNRNDFICFEAFSQFEDILRDISSQSWVVYTDGSESEGYSGSGAVLFQNNNKLHELVNPTQSCSIMYAELFAVLSVLRLFRDDLPEPNMRTEVHFFIDSQAAISALCSHLLPENHFFLLQDIRHTAVNLSKNYVFITHWIPAHLDRISFGQVRIFGNVRADTLANRARKMSLDKVPCEDDLNLTRGLIMTESALLLWKIQSVISPPDGPSSSDDFSSANADQIIAGDDLR